jgi:hypothetical protein
VVAMTMLMSMIMVSLCFKCRGDGGHFDYRQKLMLGRIWNVYSEGSLAGLFVRNAVFVLFLFKP